MARPRLKYLTDRDKEFIHEQTLRVLTEVGVCYGTPTLTGLLAGAGATVDAVALTAKLPWDLIERCLSMLPSDIHLAGREPAYDCWINDGGMLYTSDGAATYMLNDLTGERHEGTTADLAMMMRLYDAVPEIDFTWATITPGDVDARAGNLEMARITYQNSRKHLQDEVRHADQAPVFIEMLQAIAGAPLRERPIPACGVPFSRRKIDRATEVVVAQDSELGVSRRWSAARRRCGRYGRASYSTLSVASRKRTRRRSTAR